MKEKVIFFRPFPFQVGQKLHIDSGPRSGDWEVTGATERKVSLRCPVSGREVEWERFCYYVDERDAAEWPQHE